MKKLSYLFEVCRKAEKFSSTLEILKSREVEIAEEGKNYKVEKENLLRRIEDLKTSIALNNQNSNFPAQIDKVKEEIICKVGSKCLRIAEFLFSTKTCRDVFYPLVGDWREDYIIALKRGRIIDAIFISIRNYFSFAYTMLFCSKFGRLIEFIMKISDVIEFFNKFSK